MVRKAPLSLGKRSLFVSTLFRALPLYFSSEPTQLAGLAASSFLAATLLPAQSEAALVLLVRAGDLPLWKLTAVASLANTAGACLNWQAGKLAADALGGTHLPDESEKPAGPTAKVRRKAQALFQRYGTAALLFSWVPLIGDPLTFAAGMARAPFFRFLAPVALGKTARYLALAWAAST